MESVIFTRKRGMNRGKPRLWIEGAHLARAGFSAGDKWTHAFTPTGFSVTRDASGSRKVSGKPDRPIIDVSGATLGGLAGHSVLAIEYKPGAGVLNVTFYEESAQ